MPVYAAAVNCIDGRVQGPVAQYIQERYGVDYVDMITEPGPARILAEGKDAATCESIRDRLSLSSRAHGARLFFLVGHEDCAANPIGRAGQLRQIEIATTRIREWMPEGAVEGLWVDGNGVVHEVPPAGTALA